MQVLFVICRRDLCSIIRTMFRTSQELINEKGKNNMHYYNINAAEAARLIAARSNGYEITKDVMTALKGCFDSGHALFIQGGCSCTLGSKTNDKRLAPSAGLCSYIDRTRDHIWPQRFNRTKRAWDFLRSSARILILVARERWECENVKVLPIPMLPMVS